MPCLALPCHAMHGSGPLPLLPFNHLAPTINTQLSLFSVKGGLSGAVFLSVDFVM
jgi:hypothetical protein